MREQVLEAAAAWVWVPPDAVDVVAPDYRLVHYPWGTTVFAALPRRPLTEVVGEAADAARSRGHDELTWWVAGESRALDAELLALDFALKDTVDVLAAELDDVDALAARLDVPSDVEVRPADDEASLRTVARIGTEAFDGEEPTTEEQIKASVADVQEDLRTGVWRFRQFLALIGGEPVGSAGCSLMPQGSGVVRLWGAGVLAAARGRGAYRALLAARCRFAAEQGRTLALVKGRTVTSAPVLRRAGFVVHGQERLYELDISSR
jgi:RimJ/RimL family protein N-acetyltransferase